MSVDNKKEINSELNNLYRDINQNLKHSVDSQTILKRLRDNKFFQQIYQQILEIQSNEHEFVIEEILRISNNNINIHEYIETYIMNCNIFKNSVQEIISQIIDYIQCNFTKSLQAALEDLKLKPKPEKQQPYYFRKSMEKTENNNKPQQNKQLVQKVTFAQNQSEISNYPKQIVKQPYTPLNVPSNKMTIQTTLKYLQKRMNQNSELKNSTNNIVNKYLNYSNELGQSVVKEVQNEENEKEERNNIHLNESSHLKEYIQQRVQNISESQCNLLRKNSKSAENRYKQQKQSSKNPKDIGNNSNYSMNVSINNTTRNFDELGYRKSMLERFGEKDRKNKSRGK